MRIWRSHCQRRRQRHRTEGERKRFQSVSCLRHSPVPSKETVPVMLSWYIGDDHAEELGKLEQTISAHEVKRLDQLNKCWIDRLVLFL